MISLIFCVVLFVAVASALDRAPAASSRFRTAIPEDVGAPIGASLYDPPAYLLDVAEGILERSILTGDLDRATRAANLADSALSLAPADAYAWAVRAWAALALGDEAEAHRALAMSWLRAPHSRGLAAERLLLAEALGLVDSTPVDPRVAADRTALARFARIDPEMLLEEVRP